MKKQLHLTAYFVCFFLLQTGLILTAQSRIFSANAIGENEIVSTQRNTASANSPLPLAAVVISTSTDTIICLGTPVTFRVENSNTFLNPDYQWKKNGENLFFSGADPTTYTTENLVSGDIITCTVTDNGQKYTSNGIRFTIKGIIPAIHIESNNQTCFYSKASQYGSYLDLYLPFDDLSNGATNLIPSGVNDGISALTDIPFDFNYLGLKYNKFSVSSNGRLTLGDNLIGNSGNNTEPFSNISIMPWWDDLTTGNNGNVRCKLFVYKYFTKLVIEWNVNTTSVNAPFDKIIQLRLVQGANSIVTLYNTDIQNAGTGSGTLAIAGSATDFLSAKMQTEPYTSTVSSVIRTNNNTWPQVTRFESSYARAAVFFNNCRQDTISYRAKVTFSALVENGGTSPLYQWKKNGLNVGINSPMYEDSTLINNDTIWCELTNPLSCTTTPTVASNLVIIKVKPDTFYTFNSTGNWNSPANWAAGIVPPAIIPAGTEIIITPSPNGQCLLNIPVTFERGAFLTVKNGANFLVQGNLTVH